MEKERGFLLLKPKRTADANRIAKAIAMCKGVKEVFLTSGEYGFVAAVETGTNFGVQRISNLVEKAIGNVKISTVVKHYMYKRKVR